MKEQKIMKGKKNTIRVTLVSKFRTYLKINPITLGQLQQLTQSNQPAVFPDQTVEKSESKL